MEIWRGMMIFSTIYIWYLIVYTILKGLIIIPEATNSGNNLDDQKWPYVLVFLRIKFYQTFLSYSSHYCNKHLTRRKFKGKGLLQPIILRCHLLWLEIHGTEDCGIWPRCIFSQKTESKECICLPFSIVQNMRV